MLVRVSRLPVGSSARSKLRVVDQRACDRDALLLAAGQLIRVVAEPLAQADALQRLGRTLAAFLGVAHAGIEQRQLDVLDARSCAAAG